MKVSHTFKFPGVQQYEMKHYSAEADVDDIPQELREKLTPALRWRVLNFMVQRETTIAAVVAGSLTKEQAITIVDNLKITYLSGIEELVRPYGI